MLAQAVERECRRAAKAAARLPRSCPPLVPEGCLANLPAQAREMLMNARSQARATLANVRGLMDRLRPLRGPKHIVLMSGGMRFDQELLGEFNQFAHKAALQRAWCSHTIFVDQPTTDVTTERRADDVRVRRAATCPQD